MHEQDKSPSDRTAAGANSVIGVLAGIYSIFSPRERWRAVVLVGLLTFLALVEVAGIASIAPFLAVAANPDVVHSNQILAWVYESLNFADTRSFLVFVAVATVVVLLFVGMVRVTINYLKFRFANRRRHAIAMRLVQSYTSQPYSFFLRRNSSDLAKLALSETDQLIINAVEPMLELFAYGILLIAIAVLLLFIDVGLSITVVGVLSAFCAVLYFAVRGALRRASAGRARSNTERFQAASELFGGIKELKVLGRQQAYVEAFRRPSMRYSDDTATSEVLSEVPKYILEAIGFACILLVALYLILSEGGLDASLPIIALYAFAGYRVLPALQRVYSSVSRLRFVGAAVANVQRDTGVGSEGADSATSEGQPLRLRKALVLKGVSYQYEGARGAGVWDIDLTIPAGSETAIVGTTGAGKSTLIDLMLGLLQPTRGQILIDGKPLAEEDIRAWQANIGYVPQQIFLADTTIALNIAFGIAEEKLDRAAIERAARLAQVHDFIVNELPEGYDSVIGERGVRLSGGQRQRLGIARALYHDPGVIILDEATNALDVETEREVYRGIERLAGSKTVIMITHRPSSLKTFDQLIKLENGRVVRSDAAAKV
jgi:ABC-type multidrug transport system fused ATPase/permease subunit